LTTGLDRYAVIGNPIGHSLSPDIHAAFSRQTGEKMAYGRILAPLDDFSRSVREFFGSGGKGLNVTVPFKEQAFSLSGQPSRRASLAGAVNTLSATAAGILAGDNTDGVGLLRDLGDNHNIDLEGSRILLIGAGGAARGVIAPLLEAGPEELLVTNRTAEKALLLARLFADLGPIRGCGFGDVSPEGFDIVINASAAGLSGQVPAVPVEVFKAARLAYDMMYSGTPTAFVSWARAQGAAEALDGLGMLVEQAAEAFFIWRGVRPSTGPVIADLRKSLAR